MRGSRSAGSFANLAAVVVATALLAGCAVAPSQAACGVEAPELKAAPQRAAPDQPFTLRGDNFVGRFVCDDTGPVGAEGGGTRASPARDVRLEFRQGAKRWPLGTVDADREMGFDIPVEVPAGARPGSATVRAVGVGKPTRTTFRVTGESQNGMSPTTYASGANRK